MADYFTNFSFIVPFTNADHIKEAVQIAEQANSHRHHDEQLPDSFPSNLKVELEDWSFETEATKDGLWLHSGSGGIDAVCSFVQHLLQKFNPAPFVAFEWSHDCSRPRIDAYGGGAAFITAKEIKTMNTSDWLRSLDV